MIYLESNLLEYFSSNRKICEHTFQTLTTVINLLLTDVKQCDLVIVNKLFYLRENFFFIAFRSKILRTRRDGAQASDDTGIIFHSDCRMWILYFVFTFLKCKCDFFNERFYALNLNYKCICYSITSKNGQTHLKYFDVILLQDYFSM